MKVFEIISEINRIAPLTSQESWDNSGVQVGDVTAECTGVMLCVDVTPDVVLEARDRGCNLIISHHPLLFKGLKRICPGDNVVQQSVIDAIRFGITIFSSHTSLDKAAKGISTYMVGKLGADPKRPLKIDDFDTGLGCIAEYFEPITPAMLVSDIKRYFGSPMVRCSEGRFDTIKKIAVCGGSGGEFIPDAIAAGCQAYLTSDVRYHDFVDYGRQILILDIGHFEGEECAKDIFYNIISEKFPNFAVYKSAKERNPIKYL